ncbi:hypothetical protein QE152_g10560 [Popillia japonica]|uniref:Uncharacterized protein n=1 Tax=Popillia japonica TaxID=7064 RepID=A0AAW1LVY3_POPJA
MALAINETKSQYMRIQTKHESGELDTKVVHVERERMKIGINMLGTRYLTKINVILILFYLGGNNAEPQIQACGRDLVTMVGVICDHHYNGPNYRRILSADKYAGDQMKPYYFLNDFLVDYQITDGYDTEESHDRLNRDYPVVTTPTINTRMIFRHCLFCIASAYMVLQLCVRIQEGDAAELVRHYCGKTLLCVRIQEGDAAELVRHYCGKTLVQTLSLMTMMVILYRTQITNMVTVQIFLTVYSHPRHRTTTPTPNILCIELRKVLLMTVVIIHATIVR